MGVTLKTSKQRLFTTYWDIISVLNQINTEDIDISDGSATKAAYQSNQIETEIIKAGAEITMALAGIYAVADFRTTPYSTPPVADIGNTGDHKLIAITAGTDIGSAYTAAYIIKFTSATEYALTSSLEGTQGTGGLATDFNSTNFAVAIGTNAWVAGSTSIATDDAYYFSILDVYPEIWTIAVRLSASNVIENLYTAETPNESAVAEKFRNEGESMLRALQRPYSNTGKRLPSFSDESLKSQSIDYHINEYGIDDSSYSEDEPSRSGQGSSI